jgi:hypothetical protein
MSIFDILKDLRDFPHGSEAEIVFIINEDQIEQPENEIESTSPNSNDEHADTVDENQTTLAKDDYVSAIYENEWFIVR